MDALFSQQAAAARGAPLSGDEGSDDESGPKVKKKGSFQSKRFKSVRSIPTADVSTDAEPADESKPLVSAPRVGALHPAAAASHFFHKTYKPHEY